MNLSFLKSPLFCVLVWSSIWALQILVSKIAFTRNITLGCYIIQSSIISFFLCLCLFKLLPRLSGELNTLLINFTVLKKIIIAGFLHPGIASIFYLSAITSTTATNIGFLSKLSIVSTLILAHFFLDEKLNKRKLLSFFLMFSGAYFITLYDQKLSADLGALLIVFACLFWSIANVIIKAQMKASEISGEFVAFFRQIIGAPTLVISVVLLPILFPSLSEHFGENYFNLDAILYCFANAIFSLGSTMFLYKTLRIASASFVTLMSMTNPVIVAVLGYSLLGESLTTVQLFGAVLILFGGIVCSYLRE